MNDLITEMAVGLAAGGVGQGISEVLKMGHSIVDIFAKMSSVNMARAQAANKEYRENTKVETEAMDRASRRWPAWVRSAVVLIVIIAAFILSYANGWLGYITSIVTEKQPWLNLGIIRLGGGTKVTEAQGFVLVPEFWQSVRLVLWAVLGIGMVKTGKKIF